MYPYTKKKKKKIKIKLFIINRSLHCDRIYFSIGRGTHTKSESEKQFQKQQNTHCWKYLATILSRAKRPAFKPPCSSSLSSGSESEESSGSSSESESGSGSPRVVAILCRITQVLIILHARSGSYLQEKECSLR